MKTNLKKELYIFFKKITNFLYADLIVYM